MERKPLLKENLPFEKIFLKEKPLFKENLQFNKKTLLKPSQKNQPLKTNSN